MNRIVSSHRSTVGLTILSIPYLRLRVKSIRQSRQGQRSVDDHAFPQCRRNQLVRTSQRWESILCSGGAKRREEDVLAHQRDSSADDHNLRNDQCDRLSNGPAEDFGGGSVLVSGELIPCSGSFANTLRRERIQLSMAPAEQVAEVGRLVACSQQVMNHLLRGGRNPWPGSARFNTIVRRHGIQSRTQVANLSSSRPAGPMDLSIKDQSTSDAGAHGDVEDAVRIASRTEAGFCQARNVAIVAQGGRNAEFLLCPFDNRKSVPTRHLMAGLHDSLRPQHRTAESITDALNPILGHKVTTNVANLVTNPRAPFGDLNISTFKRDKVRAVAGTDSQLQLRAADFNTKKHGLGLGIGD